MRSTKPPIGWASMSPSSSAKRLRLPTWWLKAEHPHLRGAPRRAEATTLPGAQAALWVAPGDTRRAGVVKQGGQHVTLRYLKLMPCVSQIACIVIARAEEGERRVRTSSVDGKFEPSSSCVKGLGHPVRRGGARIQL